MFDTTKLNFESKVVEVTKEIEKTISPDKVTEMYDKVKEEVEKSIVKSIWIKDNKMEGVTIEFIDNFMNGQRRVRGRFLLNGKEYLLDEEIPEKATLISESELADKLFEYYKTVVAGTLVKQSVPAIFRSRD